MVTDSLPQACDACDHDRDPPDRELRQHAVAAAIRAVERVLVDHRYPDPERSLEILHVAMGESQDDYPTGLN